jgi:hypothetical protein
MTFPRGKLPLSFRFIGLIAGFELRKRLQSWAFLLGFFVLPVALAWGGSAAYGHLGSDSRALASQTQQRAQIWLVDEGQMITANPPELRVTVFRGWQAMEDMRAIGADYPLYVLPSDFAANPRILLERESASGPLGVMQSDQIYDLVRYNLGRADPWLEAYLLSPLTLTNLSGPDAPAIGSMTPLFLGAALLVMLFAMSPAGLFYKSLDKERENRTLEVLLSTHPPQVIVLGKAAANTFLGLTNIALVVLLLLGFG